MYYKKRSTILFRLYDDFGYLTDNRNFGYRYLNAPVVGDKILSLSGAISLQCLGHGAKTLEGSGGQELLYTLSAQYIPSKIVIHA